MPPQNEGSSGPIQPDSRKNLPLTSGILKYPALRDIDIRNPDVWLRGKKMDDDVYPYWRIHDKLYDLRGFETQHPGGRFWIEETQGADITELYETHHFSNLPDKYLSKFYVKEITTPRTTAFTFEEDGFYKTLKRKVIPILKEHGGTGPTLMMTMIQDSLLATFFLFMCLAAIHTNYLFALMSGVTMTFMMTAAHNFFHQKDNWRMYIFDLTVLSSREWRISHALSHHIYTNTINDYEISSLEPSLEFLPKNDKSFINRFYFGNFLLLVYNYVLAFHKECFWRFYFMYKGTTTPRITDFFPLFEWMLMYMLNGSIIQSILLLLTIHTMGNGLLLFLGLMAGHHHPDIFREGDQPAPVFDWGVHQIISTRERGELFMKSLFLATITFGNHTLHHLFPPVDHSKLPYLQDVFLETCKEFNIKFDVYTPWKHCKGMYNSLTRGTPNKNLPSVILKK